jgi:hypothetical protein
MNYIKYLTSSSNESQVVIVQRKDDTDTKSNPAKRGGFTNADGTLNDDSNEDDDTEERETKNSSNDDDDDEEEEGEVIKKTNVDLPNDQDITEEEPDDGNDDKQISFKDGDRKGNDDKDDKNAKKKKEERSKNAKSTSEDATTGNQAKQDNDEENDDASEPQWEQDLSPKIVWLASYPNSGTSYTMTLVERASNFSTATNYGNEVTHPKYDSIPIYEHHEEGPFWEGTSDQAIQLKRVIRELPSTYVLTKTHCGGRCIKCPASEYLVNTTRQFIYGCQKTSYRKHSRMITTEYGAPMSAIKKLVHLIRNPYHNVVARFHLERKNMIAKDSSYETSFTYDAAGFQNYCHYLDTTYNSDDKKLLPSHLYKKYFRPNSDTFIPCAAEFYKWVQWHNYVVQSSTLLGFQSDRTERVTIETDHDAATTTTTKQQNSIPVLVIWYENYELDFNHTFTSIMNFLQLPIATEQIRTFRELPTYDDHFTPEQRINVQALIETVAIPTTWKLIQHYF